VESLGEVFVGSLELIDLLLGGGDSLEESSVSLFFLLESPDHGLDISDSGVGLDLFEGLIDVLVLSHLLLHLDSHEVVPKFIDVEEVSHLGGVLVLTLVGGTFSNLLVSLLSVNTALDRLFFISNALLEL